MEEESDMADDLQRLENSLKALRPAGLGEGLSHRLAGGVEGRLQQLDDGERVLEAELAKLSPGGVPERVMSAFEQRVRSVPFPVDEVVVMFPNGAGVESADGPRKESDERKNRKPWLAAVAAALMAGAFSAMMINPGEDKTDGQVAQRAETVQRASAGGSGVLVPAGVDTGLGGARDEGVVWSQDRKPLRVVRVVYHDKIEFRDDAGKRVEIEVPRVEYLLVPVNVD